jgi:hypothetical protein
MNNTQKGLWLVNTGIWLFIFVSNYNKPLNYWEFVTIICVTFTLIFILSSRVAELEEKYEGKI